MFIPFDSLRYICDVVFTTAYIFFYAICNHDKVSLFIGVDPLNALSGVILKKLGIVRYLVYYTTDFSERRFKNYLLNKLYFAIDKICMLSADQTWNVSSRITALRKSQGLSDKKNLFIPNVPSTDYIAFLEKPKSKFTLVTLGVIDSQLDNFGIIDAVKELIPRYPQIKLKIIGSGPLENEYKEYVSKHGVTENVLFLGSLNHNDALREIATSGIGLALYNGKWGFNYFGDSMKCREFFCYGLPVLTTDSHSTVDDIKKYDAGIVVACCTKDYVSGIIRLFENYERYSTDSYKLAGKYNLIHKTALESIFDEKISN